MSAKYKIGESVILQTKYYFRDFVDGHLDEETENKIYTITNLIWDNDIKSYKYFFSHTGLTSYEDRIIPYLKFESIEKKLRS